MSKYYDNLLPAALFLLSLVIYSLHWLTTPPGISGDASRLGLYAFDFLQDSVFPLYVYHQFAPHSLIIYLQSLVFTVLGFTPDALRGITIVGGALATPAIYSASRWLFRDQGVTFARRAGLIAAFGLALSTFFASFSGYGIEGALLPVVELMAIGFLWRGFRQGSWIAFVLAGLFVGVSQYVYSVAHFFPIALAVASIGAILTNRQLLSRWRGLLLATTVATLVALPQWIQFLTYPDTFIARTQQISRQSIAELPDPLPIITDKLINQLLMLGWYWDNAYNPFSNQSLLTPVFVVGLVVGLGATFFIRREAYIFSFLLMGIMFLPDLLTSPGTIPSAARLIPALPFIFILASLGSTTIWGWIEKNPGLPNWTGYLVLVLVVLSGSFRQWDYATRVRPQFLAADGLEWRTGLVEIAEARYIADHLDTPILLPSSEYQRAPLAFLLAEHFPYRAGGMNEPIQPGEVVTVIQPTDPDRPTTEGTPAAYLADEWVLLKDETVYFLPLIPDSFERLNTASSSIIASNGVLAAQAFSARWQGTSSAYIPLQTSFANNLNLVGYQSSNLTAGEPLVLTFYWQPTQKIEEDVEMFVQLLDHNQEVVASLHSWPLHGVFRVRVWEPGQTVPLNYSLPIPADLSAGPYQLRVGVFNAVQHKHIPVSTGESFHLVTTINFSPLDNRVPEFSTDINFGDIIALKGYTLTPTSDAAQVTLFWQSIGSSQTDYTRFIHMVDADGQIIAQSDTQLLYPTSSWPLNEVIIDERILTPIPQGDYQIYVGWYQWDTAERLSILSNTATWTDDRFPLAATAVASGE